MYTDEDICKKLTELAKMSQAEWDSLCNNCGICCLGSLSESQELDQGTRQYTMMSCPNLDKNRKCNIFCTKRAQGKDALCHKFNLKSIVLGKSQQDSCPYVEYVFGPADFPAVVDWAKVTSEKDLKRMIAEFGLPQDMADALRYKFIMENIAPESVLWRVRYNSGRGEHDLHKYWRFITRLERDYPRG
ncbi:hypothetical protein FACS189421_14030 [Bacteroidia bacterium]|nr:hypothetical protein FACS189421_14030 [Bacteroidia bacterium]